MSNHNKKDDFDEYLTGNSELSDLYHEIDITDNADGLPGIEIDNSILAAAKIEVNSKPRKTTSPFSTNYLIPLSTAASILILFSVVSFFPDEQAIEFNPDIVVGSIDAEQGIVTELEESKEKTVINKKAKISNIEKQNQQSALLIPRSKVKNENSGFAKRKEYQSKQTLSSSVNSITADSVAEIVSSSIQPEKKSIVFSGLSDTNVNAVENPAEKSTAQAFNDVASAPVNNEFVYNKVAWQNLSSDEWLKRINKIYSRYGEKEANIVIENFNKKFPKLKLKLEDVINYKNKIQHD